MDERKSFGVIEDIRRKTIKMVKDNSFNEE